MEYLALKKNKRPMHSGWADDLYQCNREDALKVSPMIGMRCDGLVVVDTDTMEAAEAWIKFVGPDNVGRTVKTPRGMHFYYGASPGSPTGPGVAVLPDVDIRAGRGSYVVVPPSPGYQDVTVEVA